MPGLVNLNASRISLWLEEWKHSHAWDYHSAKISRGVKVRLIYSVIVKRHKIIYSWTTLVLIFTLFHIRLLFMIFSFELNLVFIPFFQSINDFLYLQVNSRTAHPRWQQIHNLDQKKHQYVKPDVGIGSYVQVIPKLMCKITWSYWPHINILFCSCLCRGSAWWFVSRPIWWKSVR